MQVSRALGGVTVLQKGGEDIIATNTGGAGAREREASKACHRVLASPNARADIQQVPPSEEENTEEQVSVDTSGGLKRCGGQGDILSGTVGTVLAWGKCYEEGAYGWVEDAVSAVASSLRC